jgi:bla regulator protein blaR1
MRSAVWLALVAGLLGLGQADTFEAVSIKPFPPSPLPPGLSITGVRGGRFRGDPITALGLIVPAFGVKDWQVVDGPSWIKTDQFVVVATFTREVAGDAITARLPVMLRGVLEDRFSLRTHREQRRLPAYALVRARADGRLGPQIRRPDVDCDAVRRERAAASPAAPPPSSSTRPACFSISAAGWIFGSGMTMQGLADYLTGGNGAAGKTDRVVVDRTGLTGDYDFVLCWSQASPPVPPQAPDWLRQAVQNAPPSDDVSVFTAVQEQLGLKLEPRDELIDVIVVDRIERPTPD